MQLNTNTSEVIKYERVAVLEWRRCELERVNVSKIQGFGGGEGEWRCWCHTGLK